MATLLALRNTPAPDDTSNRKILVRDSLIELGTTAMFVYSGTLSVLATGATLIGKIDAPEVGKIMPIAFAFGMSIATLVYATGHLSGGYMNPAVSLLMYLRRQISLQKMGCYMFCQFLGAMLGSALVWGGTSAADPDNVGSPPLNLGNNGLVSGLSAGNGFVLEFMGSVFFYTVIAQTALDKRGIANSFFPPLAIGLSLVVAHLGLIPLTGCGLNPARTFGPSMIVCMAGNCGAVTGKDIEYWIFYVAPFSAAIVVAELSHWLQVECVEEESTEEKEPMKEEEPMKDEEEAKNKVAVDEQHGEDEMVVEVLG